MPVFALDVRQGKVRTISKRHRLPAFLPPSHSPPELGASVGCVGHVKPAPGFPVVGRQTQHAQMLGYLSPLRATRHLCCRGGLGWGTRCGYRLKCTSAGVGIDWLSGNCVVAANARVTKPIPAGVFTPGVLVRMGDLGRDMRGKSLGDCIKDPGPVWWAGSPNIGL